MLGQGRWRSCSVRLVVTLALAVFGASLAAPPPSEAVSPQERWQAFSDSLGDPWPGLQRPNGHFSDYIGHDRTRYGDVMMSYALLGSGVRDRDQAEIDAGLRGVARVVRDRSWGDSVSPFETLAVAGAYNIGRRHLAGNADFVRERPVWARWLRTRARVEIIDRRRYSNHHLVEAVAVFEVLRTGLSSETRGTILARRYEIRRRADQIINESMPYVARRTERTIGGRSVAMISDPTAHPLAYHGLAAGFLARGIRLMGSRATAGARSTLRKALNASWLFTAPDGALSYYGRSNEEAWALAFTAYAAEATTPSLPAADAARMRALSERVLNRLRRAHGIGSRGLWVVPALRLDLAAGKRALDSYVSAPAFAGLAMVGVNWALDAPGAFRERPRPRPPAGALLDVDKGELAVSRRADLWHAVRTVPARPGDLRYDLGVVGLKAKRDGLWRDAMPVRPSFSGIDSAGPVLLRGGRRGIPFGRRASVRSDGSLAVRVDFLSRGETVRSGALMRFTPTSCGIRTSVAARAQDVFEHSVFFSSEPARTSDGAEDKRLSARAGEGTGIAVEGGFASVSHPRVWRARMRAPARGSRVLFSLCAR